MWRKVVVISALLAVVLFVAGGALNSAFLALSSLVAAFVCYAGILFRPE